MRSAASTLSFWCSSSTATMPCSLLVRSSAFSRVLCQQDTETTRTNKLPSLSQLSQKACLLSVLTVREQDLATRSKQQTTQLCPEQSCIWAEMMSYLDSIPLPSKGADFLFELLELGSLQSAKQSQNPVDHSGTVCEEAQNSETAARLPVGVGPRLALLWR